MKKFTFSLQYLLDAHSAREQAAEQALQLAVRRRIDAERDLQLAVHARRRQVVAMEQLSGVVKRSELAAHMRCMDRYDRDIHTMDERFNESDGRVEHCRETLRAERTARLQLENLCDREREEWAEAMQVAEQKQMDETAVGRWHRQEIMR